MECFQPPGQFCKSDISYLFSEEISHVKVSDLRVEHGGLVPSCWFNSDAKGPNKVFVGSLFGLIPSNFRQKNPAEGKFSKTELLKTAKDLIIQFKQPFEGGKEKRPPKVGVLSKICTYTKQIFFEFFCRKSPFQFLPFGKSCSTMTKRYISGLKNINLNEG